MIFHGTLVTALAEFKFLKCQKQKSLGLLNIRKFKHCLELIWTYWIARWWNEYEVHVGSHWLFEFNNEAPINRCILIQDYNGPVQPVAIVNNERCTSCMSEEGTRFIAFIISFEIVLDLCVIWITATICADIVVKFLNNTHIFMIMMLVFILFGDRFRFR